MRYPDILQTIGRTPVVALSRLAPPQVSLFAKLEAFNPMGSVKDRMALAVIEDAEARGKLVAGQTVVEATSGNTGIGLAMVCARKGYPLVIVMAENFSVERRRLMRFLGARVVLTPAALKGSGMLAKARELASVHGWFLPSQFDNEANARAHQFTTASEILADFADAAPTHWVTGSGTGGTLLGVGRVLRRAWPQMKIIVCEPDNAPLLASGIAMPAPAADGSMVSHPQFRPHLMQGWTPDFIAPLLQRARDEHLIDEVLPVAGALALKTARELAQREGILAGISGGATVAGALMLSSRLPAGSRLLAMVPDTGERYLSTALFADIEAEMDEAEWAVSRSSPLARFDAPAAPASPVAVPEPSVLGRDLVQQALADASRPVLMFALEWCEFCWTLRRFFKRIGVALHSVDLDSAALQASGHGPEMRVALHRHTGQSTIPQVFVAGQWLGGCTDTLAAWQDGRLAAMLRSAGLGFDASAVSDADALLPAWLQPRNAR